MHSNFVSNARIRPFNDGPPYGTVRTPPLRACTHTRAFTDISRGLIGRPRASAVTTSDRARFGSVLIPRLGALREGCARGEDGCAEKEKWRSRVKCVGWLSVCVYVFQKGGEASAHATCCGSRVTQAHALSAVRDFRGRVSPVPHLGPLVQSPHGSPSLVTLRFLVSAEPLHTKHW